VADDLLASSSEAELPQTQAWRRAFARMGLKPTQYRCASEALLRRYKKERSLPSIHPLVDLCNAVSLAYAIPVAALDVDQIAGSLRVRYADGNETYLAFSGQTEHPYPGEVIFADDAGNVHARRWTNRQSALSAMSPVTTTALIVAEGMHESASADVRALIATRRRGADCRIAGHRPDWVPGSRRAVFPARPALTLPSYADRAARHVTIKCAA
jgi:DNA/RNA-binding domain of Phe-tRNA-synthetase-like protein